MNPGKMYARMIGGPLDGTNDLVPYDADTGEVTVTEPGYHYRPSTLFGYSIKSGGVPWFVWTADEE